jgi:hypothetical protein
LSGYSKYMANVLNTDKQIAVIRLHGATAKRIRQRTGDGIISGLDNPGRSRRGF